MKTKSENVVLCAPDVPLKETRVAVRLYRL